MKKISIIVPCFNEEEAINYFYKEIDKTFDKLKNKAKLELILVNDGSSDNTIGEFRKLAKKDSRVKYVHFSRNFGKEAAMYAGFMRATGDYITTMDADLQDPPELLEQMIDTLDEGEYDCVATKSTSRHGYSFLRKLFTKWFYKIIGKLSTTEMVPGARDYRLMTRQMMDAILSMKEYNRYSKGMFSFVGFKTKWIEFENKERVAGTTSWNFWKLFYYALDGIVGYSTKVLLWPAFMGVFTLLISIIMFIIMIIFLIISKPVSLALLLSSLIVFFSGLILFFIGVIGEYLGKTYQETLDRPIYIVKETEEEYLRK